MKWVKNLFKKPEVKQTQKIKFGDIETFLLIETKEKKLELEPKLNQFKENFINYLELLNKDFDELENSEFDKIILEDKRDISNIVRTSRRNYCFNSKKLFVCALESLRKGKSPHEVGSTVSEIFNKLNKFSREAQILLTPFQNQMKKISFDLKKLKEELDRFESFLDLEYSLIQKEKKANEFLNKIKENKLNKEQKEIKKKELEKEIKKLKEGIEKQNSKILEIKNSADADELKNLEKQQILFGKQIEDIISNITYSVNSVNRQIREYLYIADKKEKSKIKDFLENPENLLRGDDQLFKKVIKDVKKNIKKIESDERKRRKFLEVENRVADSINKNIVENKRISEKSEENIRKIKKLKYGINTEKEEHEISKLSEQIQQLEKDKKELESGEVFDEKELLNNLEGVLSDISGKEIKLNKSNF